MKVNEMPERIYIFDYNDAMVTQIEGDTVYVREDVFIEKASVKLKKLMYDNLMFQGRLHREEVIDNFVGEFRKYMEEK